MGFEGDEMYDRHGRPRRVNLLSVADYFSNDILAFDRYAQPESNRVYPLYPHQRIILNEMMDRVFLWVQVMRGGAKSSSFARGFIDYALMNPGAKIVLTAPTFRQSLLVFDEIARLIDLNAKNANSSFSIKGELKGDIRRGTIEALVEFKNGSLIKAVPMGDGSKIRGLRGGILFVDEGYQITEEMYESHLAPFAGVEFNGRPSKIIITTTSWYADCFAYRRMMQIASEVKAGNPKYGILDFTLEDLETPGTVAVFRDGKYALEQKAFPLSKDISRDARMHGDPLKYAMTYYNFWPSANIRWYDQKSIDDAVASYHDVNIEMKRPAGDGSSYFGVVDLAASDTGDSTCILVAKVSKGIARWVYGVKAKGWNGHRRAWEAHEVIRRFGMDFLIYDAHGALGVDFKSDMAQDSLLVKDEAGNVSVKKVPPTVHYDERNKRGAPILIPLRVNDDAIAAALTGDKNTPIEGEDGLNNLLHSKMRDLLQNGNMIGPGLDATTYLSDDQAAKTSYSGSEIEALDVVRSSFMQLASISLDKGLDGDIKTTKNGKLVFKKKNAASVDDGAFCLIYGVVGLLRLSGNDTTLSPRPKPIVRTLSADQIDGISVDQESVCNSQRLNYR